jgi:hypothetical protein
MRNFCDVVTKLSMLGQEPRAIKGFGYKYQWVCQVELKLAMPAPSVLAEVKARDIAFFWFQDSQISSRDTTRENQAVEIANKLATCSLFSGAKKNGSP